MEAGAVRFDHRLQDDPVLGDAPRCIHVAAAGVDRDAQLPAGFVQPGANRGLRGEGALVIVVVIVGR